MAKKPVERGAVGFRVAAELRRLRQQQRLTLKEVSDRLSAIGRPKLPSSVSRVEEGLLRVDVDDLVAFALALGTTPNHLLGWDEHRVPPIDLDEPFTENRRARLALFGEDGVRLAEQLADERIEADAGRYPDLDERIEAALDRRIQQVARELRELTGRSADGPITDAERAAAMHSMGLTDSPSTPVVDLPADPKGKRIGRV